MKTSIRERIIISTVICLIIGGFEHVFKVGIMVEWVVVGSFGYQILDHLYQADKGKS